MIIQWDYIKFGKSRSTLATGLFTSASGSVTATLIVPRYPTLPIVPEMILPRPWVMYFQEIHDFLKKHIEDNQLHNIK